MQLYIIHIFACFCIYIFNLRIQIFEATSNCIIRLTMIFAARKFQISIREINSKSISKESLFSRKKKRTQGYS